MGRRVVVVFVMVFSLLAGWAVAVSASSVQLTTGIGNVSGGKIEQEAAKIANTHLQGPKGTGLTRGITSNSITVGCIYTASSYPGFQTGIQGAFNVVNKQGGVAGRKLKLLPCDDDGNSVQTNVTQTQQLVNEDHVFSVMSLTQNILPGSTDFLINNQVPFYGWGFNPGFCGTRWGFGFSGCVTGNGYPLPIEGIAGGLAGGPIKATGHEPSQVRVAAQNENTPSGQAGAAEYAAIFPAVGAKVVYNATNLPSTTVTDFTPYVSAILASNPNLVVISTGFNQVAPLAAALKAAGYKGALVDYVTYVPGLLQSSPQLTQALQGEYIYVQFVPQEEDTPYIASVTSALKAAGSSTSLVTLGENIGYSEATMFIEMLQAIGKNLNTKTFDQKVNGGGYVSYAGLMSKGGPGPINWPAGHYLPSDCSAMVQVQGTEYKVAVKYQCYQTAKVDKG